MAAACHRELLSVDAALERPVHRFQEVVAVLLRLEAEQVVTEHPIEYLFRPRAQKQLLGIGPGDVPEVRHH